MSAVAGQTAEPNGLKFLKGTLKYHESNISSIKKKSTGNAGYFSLFVIFPLDIQIIHTDFFSPFV